jgi:serine/threonine protein kinase
MELTTAPGIQGFGYIMPLRDARHKALNSLLLGRIDPTFRALATAGLGLAHSFLQLHAEGFCYCDVSSNNVSFDPDTGDICIWDNDNVIVNGEKPDIVGTMNFMAPEIVRGEALPSTQTDLFSLAVLLFLMFMVHHPLDGKKAFTVDMERLFGTEPVFIFDPNDPSNEPDPDYHKNALTLWPIYPQFLRDLFIKAFTDGIRDRQNGRVQEGVWRPAMVRLRDSIMYCQSCRKENFYDVDALRASGCSPAPCWACGQKILLPARIRIGKNVAMLNHDTQLFPHHVDNQRMYDFSQPVAVMTRHPTDPRIWGLKNVSGDKWVRTTAGGKMQEIEPGRSVTLAVGTKIHFGKVEGEIRV